MFRESLVFSIRPFYVGFVLGKVPLGQVSLQAFRFSYVTIIPPALSTLALFTFSQQLTQFWYNKSNNRYFKTQKCTLWTKENLWLLNKVMHLPLLFNPLKPELNPICYLLALLGVHHFLHVSRIRVKLLTLRLLMSYIYGAPILDVSRSHTTTQHSR